MSVIHINYILCNMCEDCGLACPVEAIRLNLVPRRMEVNEDLCKLTGNCIGVCMVVCSQYAISLKDEKD